MGGYDPTPTDVTVDAVPIVVTSMTRAGKRAAVAGTLALVAVTIAILLGAGPALAQQNTTAPQNLRSEVSDAGHIVLNWEAPSEDAESVTGYEILRRRPLQNEQTLLSYVADTGSTATTYTDTAVEPGVRYVYRVVALRGQARSVRSNFTRLTVPEWNDDDLAPSRLVARVGDDDVQLSWQAPAVNGGSVTGYRVLRAQDDAAMTTLASDSGSTETSYVDHSAMAPGASYSYQVMALRGSQASQGSNISVVSIPEQARAAATTRADADATAPSNLAAVLSDATIRLSWDAPTEDDSTVTGYQVLRRHAGLPFSVLKAHTGDTDLTYVDDNAARRGMTYDYQVKALRSADLSAPSNVASVTRPASCTDGDLNTSPVDVPVTATPIVVSSTASDYFVLFVRPDLEIRRRDSGLGDSRRSGNDDAHRGTSGITDRALPSREVSD